MSEPADFSFPRVQALPDAHDRATLRIDGNERVGYEFGPTDTRPFLYPLIGSKGRMLTRMGHPNPVGHEHHKSIWFGHEKVNGVNFWADQPRKDIRIIHRRVAAYRDGTDWAALAADLEWRAEGRLHLKQALIIALEPRDDGGLILDLQSRFEANGAPVELGRTNFGFLGVRVAKTISAQFGGGRLLNADGAEGEPAIFGKTSRWVDYSGLAAPGKVEGIAYFDHPDNPGHPTHWHVRGDGWFSAAFNLAATHLIAPEHPLDLRYRLLIHAGPADPDALNLAWTVFAEEPSYQLSPASGQEPPTIRRLSAAT